MESRVLKTFNYSFIRMSEPKILWYNQYNPFVRLGLVCLEHTIFILWPQILHYDFIMTSGWLHYDFIMTSGWLQDDFRSSEWLQNDFRRTSGWSESTQAALRRYSESTQRARKQSDFIIPSELKILCLVINTLESRMDYFSEYKNHSQDFKFIDMSDFCQNHYYLVIPNDQAIKAWFTSTRVMRAARETAATKLRNEPIQTQIE